MGANFRAMSYADKFTWTGGDFVLTQCASCRHLSAGTMGTGCAAFPGGIPDEIILNQFDHRQRHPNDDGKTLFEARDGVTASQLEPLWASITANQKKAKAP